MTMPIDLSKLPEGTWIRRESDTVIIGAILRDSILFNLSFAIVWSLSMLATPYGIITGNWFLSLMSLPFFLAGIWLWHNALMSLFGHVEIRLEEEQGTIFSGIGQVGKISSFVYEEVYSIEEYVFTTHNETIDKYAIRIEGEEWNIRFGGYMQDERRAFLIKMIQLFMIDGDQIRDLLPPNLIKHLTD